MMLSGIGCRSEHSVEIVSARVDAWRLAADTEERRATISLRDIPRNAPGEAGLLFVLGADEVWRPKDAPDLLASLMKTSR